MDPSIQHFGTKGQPPQDLFEPSPTKCSVSSRLEEKRTGRRRTNSTQPTETTCLHEAGKRVGRKRELHLMRFSGPSEGYTYGDIHYMECIAHIATILQNCIVTIPYSCDILDVEYRRAVSLSRFSLLFSLRPK